MTENVVTVSDIWPVVAPIFNGGIYILGGILVITLLALGVVKLISNNKRGGK